MRTRGILHSPLIVSSASFGRTEHFIFQVPPRTTKYPGYFVRRELVLQTCNLCDTNRSPRFAKFLAAVTATADLEGFACRQIRCTKLRHTTTDAKPSLVGPVLGTTPAVAIRQRRCQRRHTSLTPHGSSAHPFR
jgi:hypothetical protein